MSISGQIRSCRILSVVLCALAMGAASAPASAQGWLMLGPQSSALALLALGTGSHCVTFTYDLNGNRLSQSSTTMGSGSTNWGSGSFGCFTWEQ